jgi:hypothetical protein
MAFRGNILTGARARFSVDGVKVALAMNVTYGEQIEHQPIEPLDQFDVAENVPIAYRVNLSSQMVRIITNTIKNRDGVVIFPTFGNILTREEATCTIEDTGGTGVTIANIERVKATRYNVNIGSRGIVMVDTEFVAIRVRNESEIV